MKERKIRGRDVRQFILDEVWSGNRQPAKAVCGRFGISRQAAGKHLNKLLDEGKLSAVGATRARRYSLVPLVNKSFEFVRAEAPAEDEVWNRQVEPLIAGVADNVVAVLHFGFTEMFNNALDHSEAKRIVVDFIRDAVGIRVEVRDNGVGIFNKLIRAFGFEDEQQAALEVSKGKLTTDPERHSGQGLFFTSKMFDPFIVFSGSVYFSCRAGSDVWISSETDKHWDGTSIWLKIRLDADLTAKEVFDRYTASEDGDYAFDKTIVPVELARMGEERLVSRSQAKRLLARVDKFDEVVLNFDGVKTIGQAFADEIFRVFQNRHPTLKLFPIRTTKAVDQMIARARSG